MADQSEVVYEGKTGQGSRFNHNSSESVAFLSERLSNQNTSARMHKYEVTDFAIDNGSTSVLNNKPAQKSRSEMRSASKDESKRPKS